MKYNFDIEINREGTNSYKFDLQKKLNGRDDLMRMWVADMDFEVPPMVYDEIVKRASHKIYGYTLKPDSFYESIINWYEKRHNWKIKKEWIIFSPGVVPSLAFSILAYTNPGDKIIIQPPVYHPFFHVVKSNKRKLVLNPLKIIEGQYKMDFDDLEKKIVDAKMLILCSPHNPVGRVWTEEELLKLSEICIKNNVLIISDEIHADIIFKPNKHIPLANINTEIADNTITTIAPSKTFNIAGLSTSVVIIPNKKLNNQFQKVINNLHVGMGNIFGDIALEASYKNGEDWLNQLLEYLQDNMQFVNNYLNKNIPEINLVMPEATYLLWLNCKSLGLNNNELKDFFLNKAKIWFNDGPSFGQGGEGFQRMNIGCSRSIIKTALEKIKYAIDNI